MDSRGYVTGEETRIALHSVYHGDPEINLQDALQRAFADELRPRDEKGRWHPSFLVIQVCLLALALLSVFLYFCIGAPR